MKAALFSLVLLAGSMVGNLPHECSPLFSFIVFTLRSRFPMPVIGGSFSFGCERHGLGLFLQWRLLSGLWDRELCVLRAGS
ncbi:MAG: hypothetical protein ACKPB4_02040 [Sphaerospermopsis kisseleviana]